MGKHKQVSCKTCFKIMRSDHVTRHLEMHMKFTAKEVSETDICKEILLELVDKVLDENRSDVNIKYDEDNVQEKPEIKRNYYEEFGIDEESLRKRLIEQTFNYKQKIALGENVYKILGEGEVEEGALAKDMKDALDLYMKQGKDLNYMDVDLKPWQRALMEEVNTPSDRHVIWVIGEKGNEGKTWFQKYIKSTYGARRVVSGIHLMAMLGSICHALT